MYRNGETSVYDYIKSVFDKIENSHLNSFITLNKEKALEKAAELDKKLACGCDITSLFGIPVGVKDNMLTKGLRTTAGSHFLDDFIPVFDATVIEKLDRSDAILIGKTNMDEFAMGGSSETSYYGLSVNPMNEKLIPGGSSSGSATAVSGDEVVVSLGSDTGGSVRNPANYCNVVGFAPTYGAVSRFGVISMANSLDRVGVISHNVADARTVFDAIRGIDEYDFTTIELHDRTNIKSLEGIKFAYVKILDSYEADQEVIDNYEIALDKLRKEGAILEEVELHHLSKINGVYTILMSVEASANMARLDGIRYGESINADEATDLNDLYRSNRTKYFGEETKRRIALGNYFASKENDQKFYKKAMEVRQLFKQMFDEILARNDYFISPTNTQLPYEVGSKLHDANAAYDSGMFNTITNLIDLPSITIPVDKEKLGSVQVIGRRKEDYNLLDVAEMLEGSFE